MALDFPNSPSVGQEFTVGGRSWKWNGSRWIVSSSPLSRSTIDDIGDVSITSVTNGDFLRYNGSASVWINDPVNLSTDTVGDYVQSLVAGTGVSLSNNSGEGSTPTVAIGQAVGTSDSPTFTGLTINGASVSFEGSSADDYETTVTVGNPTADRVITLPDATDTLVGKATTDTFTNKTFNTAGAGNNFSINNNQITSYVGSGQNVVLSTYPTITSLYTAGLTVDSTGVAFEGANADANQTSLVAAEPTADRTITLPNASGTVALNGSIALGTDTTGNYMADVSGGTGISISHIQSEGSTATVSLNATLDNLSDVDATSPSNGQFLKYVSASSAWVPANIPTINSLDDVGDVSAATPTSGDFLKWNGTAWVNDPINLGTDTTGNYVGDVSSGTGVTVSHVAGEGSTPTISIGQDVSTSASVEFHQLETQYDVFVGRNLYVSGSVSTINQVSLELDDPFIYLNTTASVGGIDTGVVASYFDGSHKHAGYFRDSTDGKFKFFDSYSPEPTTPIDTDHASYSAAPIVAETFESTVTTGTAPLTVSSTTEVANLHADTATSLHTSRAISLSGDLSGSVSFDGSADVQISATIQPNSVALGTDTTGNYVSDVVAGTGITVTHTPGEGSSASVLLNATLDNLSNVTAPSPSDGQFLKYVSASTAWVPANIPTINNLDDIGDVVITSASASQILQYNGTNWVNSSLDSGGPLTVSSSSPSTPAEGDLWFDSDTAQTFVYYDSAWVEIGGSSGGARMQVLSGAPTSPLEGTMWFDSDTAQTFVYYDSQWIEIGASAMAATVSTTAPSGPIAGQVWFNSDTGGTYVYYGTTWIEIGAAPANAILQAVDAKGDLIVGTADNTVDNLTVGSNNQILMADSSTATGLKWATSPETDLITTKGDLLVGTAADTLARQGVGSNGQILVANSGQTNGIAWVDPLSNRNVIINGAMQVAQRGTSTASITTNGFYTADRYNLALQTQGTWTQSVENDAPTGSGLRKSLKMLCTTADASPTGGDNVFIYQSFEGQNVQQFAKGTVSAKQFAVSFWVKSNVTGTYIVELVDNDNNRVVSAPYTISASATWEKKTIIFPADTTGVWDNDNANSGSIVFWLGAGTNYTSGTLGTTWSSITTANRAVGQTNLASATNNYWQVTGVQLEAGAVATPFEFEDYGTTLQKCYRYYQRYTSHSAYGPFGFGSASSTTNVSTITDWLAQPRAIAGGSMAYSNVSVGDGANAMLTASSASWDHSSYRGALVNWTVTGATQFRPYFLLANNNAAGWIAWSFEL